MRREEDLRQSPEKLLSYFLLFLSGYHLDYWQGKLQGPLFGFPLGESSDSDSIRIWEWVGYRLKFLTINAYPLGLCVAHSLELIADFMLKLV